MYCPGRNWVAVAGIVFFVRPVFNFDQQAKPAKSTGTGFGAWCFKTGACTRQLAGCAADQPVCFGHAHVQHDGPMTGWCPIEAEETLWVLALGVLLIMLFDTLLRVFAVTSWIPPVNASTLRCP